MKTLRPILLLGLLAAAAFTLATAVEPYFRELNSARTDEGAFTKLLGDGRRMFSGQAVEMADVYLHSGFYPSIFDERGKTAPKAIHASESHETHDADDHEHHKHDAEGHCVHDDDRVEAHEEDMDFMGTPRDWLEGFIRRFRITEHTHLENGDEREIMPWLKLAIELNPQALETYIDTAYWLRVRLGRTEDARKILREGIRNNPRSYELLFEMGALYEQADKDDVKARNIWLAALRLWQNLDDAAKTENRNYGAKIAVNLGQLETRAGDYARALQHYEIAKAYSPSPQAIEARIAEVHRLMATGTPQASPAKMQH